MIEGFYSRYEKELFEGGRGRREWDSFRKVARRKLVMVDAAITLSDFKSPPNNKFEALKRDREGQHAIRINDQYRVCFEWRNGSPHRVEITDYHD